MGLCLGVVFLFAFVDWFASVEVVEFGWAFVLEGASLMVRPLASDSERTEWSDVHGVDNKNSASGARQLRADDAQ